MSHDATAGMAQQLSQMNFDPSQHGNPNAATGGTILTYNGHGNGMSGYMAHHQGGAPPGAASHAPHLATYPQQFQYGVPVYGVQVGLCIDNISLKVNVWNVVK